MAASGLRPRERACDTILKMDQAEKNLGVM